MAVALGSKLTLTFVAQQERGRSTEGPRGKKLTERRSMDLEYSSEELAFRDEVRSWLRENLPAELRRKVESYQSLSKEELLGWHRTLAAKGWVAPAWPVEWGGTGWSPVQRYIFEEECGYAAAPPLIPFGLMMCAPVLLEFGSD